MINNKKMDVTLVEFIEAQTEFNQQILKSLNDRRIGYSENKYETVDGVGTEKSPLMVNDENPMEEKKANVVSRLQAYMNEFIGVFFIALSVVLLVAQKNPVMGPLSSGFLIVALVYAGGHLSRAHYNPAMTVLFFLRHEISVFDGIAYIAMQHTAAFIGFSVGAGLIPVESQVYVYEPAPTSGMGQAFVVEFLFTFLLGWIVLNVATAKANHGNEFYGLAVGSVLISIVATVSHISGACLNPSLGVGSILFHAIRERSSEKLVNLWIYTVGAILGAIFAAILFFLTHTEEAKNVVKIVRKDGIKRILY
jgi:aquaporin Z